ncbi:hypothetical protein RclHR1_22850004 [Rhizophagus clarus]|uniref:Uncharacterized protein n=1 Tax=Rhizophagus clarus TaxID=94130 RepID=A0A2Z6QUR1_9GLOM|nr:hypothetical protein RclHR1_22850004 [Rhizophagus clarus]GES85914.1 hypothetical protein GLOIN_2v1762049 [Rhizophagus clarus]
MPNSNASGGLDASMHAQTMTLALSLNASPDKATDKDLLIDCIPVLTPTFSIERNDYQAAAASNSTPETLKISSQMKH